MKQYFKNKFALSEQGAKEMIFGIISVVAQNLALMFPVTLLYIFTGDYIEGVNLQSRTGFYIGGIALCLVLIVLTSIWQYNTAYKATYKESAARRISLAEKLRKLPLSFFAKRDLADLTSTIMSDAEVMEHAGSHMIPQYYGSIISTLIICIGLFFFRPEMALAAVWPIPIALVIVLTSKRVQNHFSRRQRKAQIDLNEGVQEFIETSRDLKSNNAENEYLNGLYKKIDALEKRSIGSELGTAMFVVSAQMLLKFGIGTVALVGGTMLIGGSLTLMQFFCFLLVASRLYEPMSSTLINLAAINALQINVDRMNEINNTKEQEGSTVFEPKGYDIVFDHAGFSYEDDKTVLSDVSFTAKPTVSRLAARFWDTTSGTITFGGENISEIDPETLMNYYSIVFQDVTLFNNTVMENIRVGKKEATDEEVMQAAKLAHCDEFVDRLPDGYNTVIGENGGELSGGERQRISIARAFLKDAPVILLDKATASLDAENETLIQSSLSRLIKNKTVIIIAHRMRTVANADKIVVISEGRSDEQGTPSELLKKDGIYAKMVKFQTESKSWSI